MNLEVYFQTVAQPSFFSDCQIKIKIPKHLSFFFKFYFLKIFGTLLKSEKYFYIPPANCHTFFL